MLRLIHAQTVTGHILVDDIDDGLPNKQVHRLGSKGDPKSYKRDGYAGVSKQSCYIPRVNASNASLAGFIDLRQTERVIRSANNGKIAKLVTAGLITTTTYTSITKAAVTADTIDGTGVTLTGTNFASVLPYITSIRLAGAGVGAGGVTVTVGTSSVTITGSTTIFIPIALVTGVAAGDTVVVTANGLASDSFTLT